VWVLLAARENRRERVASASGSRQSVVSVTPPRGEAFNYQSNANTQWDGEIDQITFAHEVIVQPDPEQADSGDG